MLQKAKPLWRGIRRHGAGWQTCVRVTGHRPVYTPYPLDTDPKAMQRDRKATRDALKIVTPPATAGTFAKDAQDYLTTILTMPDRQERTRHIGLWVAEFGARARATIKPWEIAAVRDRWLTIGPKRVMRRWRTDGIDRHGARWVELAVPLSASQVNNRLRALENLYTVLDGRRADNPVREISEAEEPDGDARGLPYDVVEALLSHLPDRGRPDGSGTRPTISLTKLRLRVIAYVGLSHGELKRVGSSDLHLDAPLPWVWIAGRRKGKGTKGTAQPLTEEGAAALGALVEAGGLGGFSHSAMWASFQRACSKLELSGIRPYDLRHSWATEVYEKTGGNLPVVQLLMRQKSPATAQRYGKRAIDPIRAAAIAAVRAAGGFKGG
jgi:integrase